MTCFSPSDEDQISDLPSATVIPFPAPGKVIDPLTRALGSLQAALASQKAAMTAWRDSLQDLQITTKALDNNMQRYHGSLRSLGAGVTQLNRQAKALAALTGCDPTNKN